MKIEDISNLIDAGEFVLQRYHETKKELGTQPAMVSAIAAAYVSWGKKAEYEEDTFTSSIFTLINSWRKRKPSPAPIIETKPSQKNVSEQLSLFGSDFIKRTVRKINKKKIEYRNVTFATH